MFNSTWFRFFPIPLLLLVSGLLAPGHKALSAGLCRDFYSVSGIEDLSSVLSAFEGLSTSGPRLLLRPAVEADEAFVYALAEDPRVVEMQGEGPILPAHLDGVAPLPEGFVKVIVLKETGAPLGFVVGTIEPARGGGRSSRIGYALDPNAWGRGHMTEAVRLLTTALHESAGVTEVQALVADANGASRRVLGRTGYRRVTITDEVLANAIPNSSLFIWQPRRRGSGPRP
jgi:RimJ/RimL family protein N-acetyltransferase